MKDGGTPSTLICGLRIVEKIAQELGEEGPLQREPGGKLFPANMKSAERLAASECSNRDMEDAA